MSSVDDVGEESAAHYAAPPRELRGLATALYILLSAQLVVCGLSIAATVRSNAVPVRLTVDRDGSIYFDANGAADVAGYISVLQLALLAATAVVWIRWLYRARLNLYAWGIGDRRIRPGWAVGGWFVPILNLVVPAIVTYDVVGAGEAAAGRPAGRGRHVGRALAVLWGVGFAATAIVWVVLRRSQPDIPPLDELAALGDAELDALDELVASYETLFVVAQGLTLLVSVVAMALVGSLTRRQTALIERRVPTPAA